MASIRPGAVSSTTAWSRAMVREHALDVLGEDVEAIRQDDDVLLATGEDEAPFVVEASDIPGVVPAILVEGGRGGLGVLPIARAHGRTGDENLGIRRRQLQPDRREGASHHPGWMIVLRIAGGETDLGRTVALDDPDTEVLPIPLELGCQVRGRNPDQSSVRHRVVRGWDGIAGVAPRMAGGV